VLSFFFVISSHKTEQTMKFLRNLLASFLGTIIAGTLLIFIVFGMITALLSMDDEVVIKDNSVLLLKLDRQVVDRVSDNPFDNLNIQGMNIEDKMGLNDLLNVIDKASRDEKIKGIFMNITDLSAGAATLEEIRTALMEFKKSKKFIIAYSDQYSQGGYYLASTADKIYLNPEGLVEFRGMSANLMFFKNALQKLEVEPVIIRGTGNKFKSAVEPLTEEKMSEANRKQTSVYMGSIWQHILKGISESRNIPVDSLNAFADNMTIRNAQACLDNKLVDGLIYFDEVQDELKKLVEVEDDKDFNMVGYERYNKYAKFQPFAAHKIAVIYATGEIGMGKGDFETIGSETLSGLIRKARKDNRINAIVLRVNSPGGSALASEAIWREMELASKEKVVVVSMGDVAASGGYYIACNADTIVADHTTLTGSIGVFGIIPIIDKFMKNTLGVTFDTVKTNLHSDIGSMYRPMNDDEKAVIQFEVDRIYSSFLSHVSKGRGIEVAMVDSIGQGRVWSGINALELKLVDVHGGLTDAIKIAADMAGLKTWTIEELPVQKDPFEKIMNIMSKGNSAMISTGFPEGDRILKAFKSLSGMRGIQARMLFDLEIK